MPTFFRLISGISLSAGVAVAVMFVGSELPLELHSLLLPGAAMLGGVIGAAFFWSFADLIVQVRRLSTLLAPPTLDVEGAGDRERGNESDASLFLDATWTREGSVPTAPSATTKRERRE